MAGPVITQQTVGVLATMQDHDVEEIVAISDRATGLLGFIVLHDTTRGPAIGGCRLHAYPSERAALEDGVALAVTMTRKCALAGLNAGGGKGVFIDHPGITDRPAMLRALGRYVESLSGRFYTSGDLGLGVDDLQHMRETTRFVAVPDRASLDLAGATASGVLAGMRAALDLSDLRDCSVVVQGLGAMGGRIAALLLAQGVRVLAADLDPGRAAQAEALGATLLDPEAVYDAPADVFCPCATSGVLTSERARRLPVRAVVGAANNQLAEADAERVLVSRGIRYAPDYSVNAGAVALGALHFLERRTDYHQTTQQIEETVHRIFEASDRTGELPSAVADRLAREALVRPKTTEQQWWPIR